MINLDKLLYQVNKPARYTGGEWNSVKKPGPPIRIALSYPDVYEIGMSNMALPILYDALNRQPGVAAERVFAPWVDMAAALRRAAMPLFSLETRTPLKDFDIIGFSLGHELTYTNVLEMLDLAQLPVLAAERNASHPLVIAGGSCALNPEPLSDFIDLFVLGDGEEAVIELVDAYRVAKAEGLDRAKMLRELARLPGVYVPSLYQAEYDKDGLIKSLTPAAPEASPVIRRRMVYKLPVPVTRPVVPYIETVHDRAAIEVQRGCSRGCRFCQAGIIYRPVRERPQHEAVQAVDEILTNCGYNEVSLVSLSTGDYPDLDKLVHTLAQRHPDVAISLPSLYVDSFSLDILEALPNRRKSGLTFAPEAGSERLRRSINKNITEDKLMETAATAFERGWTGIKLYFLLGLPTETIEDAESVARLVEKVRLTGRSRARTPEIRVNLSTLVPKAHTPFQWAPQVGEEILATRRDVLKLALHKKGVKLAWPEPKASLLEAVLARGDRRLGRVIYTAWRLGCVFDSWSDCFSFDKWQRAFDETGLEPGFYAHRQRALDELLPWSHIDTGVSAAFLKREWQRSLEARETPDCRHDSCNACGLESHQPACPKIRKEPELGLK